MKILQFVLLAMLVTSCRTYAPPCTKILHEFYEDAAGDDMNMGRNMIENDRMIYGAFNKDRVIVLCLIGTNANYDGATKCASGTVNQGVCRYKDGRFMGYSYGEASASDLIQDIK